MRRSSSFLISLLFVCLLSGPCRLAGAESPHAPEAHAYKIMFLLPVADNQGAPFPPSAYTDIEENLLRIADGYTYQGIVEGAFHLSDGTISRDHSRQYFVSSPHPEAIQEILSDAARRFSQEALYSEITQPEVIFIRPKSN